MTPNEIHDDDAPDDEDASPEEELDRLDEERIVRDLVTEAEIAEMVERLVRRFYIKARALGVTTIPVIEDPDEWRRLRESGEAYAEDRFILYHDLASDSTPIEIFLMKTLDDDEVGDEALFVAKYRCFKGLL